MLLFNLFIVQTSNSFSLVYFKQKRHQCKTIFTWTAIMWQEDCRTSAQNTSILSLSNFRRWVFRCFSWYQPNIDVDHGHWNCKISQNHACHISTNQSQKLMDWCSILWDLVILLLRNWPIQIEILNATRSNSATIQIQDVWIKLPKLFGQNWCSSPNQYVMLQSSWVEWTFGPYAEFSGPQTLGT